MTESPIDIDLTVFHGELIVLIGSDRTLIKGNILHIQVHRGSLFGYPYRSVVVACPPRIGIQGLEVARLCIGVQANRGHDVPAGSKFLSCFMRQRQVAELIERGHILV